MSTTEAPIPLADVPVIDITPPSGWLDLKLRELWQFRELLYFFVWRDIKIRYKQTAIGAAWAVIQPLATMLVFTLFFGRLAKIPVGRAALSDFLLQRPAALDVLRRGAPEHHECGGRASAHDHQGVLPPAGFAPFGSGFGSGGFCHRVCGVLGHDGLLPCPSRQSHPGVSSFLLLAVATALGAGLWLSALNAIYRDVRYVVPFLIQFWMFASPVAYPSTLVPERWRWLYGLNPMAGVIEGFRWSLTGKGQPPSLMLAASAGAVIVVLIGGLFFFRRMEGTIADVV